MLIFVQFYDQIIIITETRLTPAGHMVYVCLSDINPQVNFYWRRGQRIIPKGHRRGRLEPTRFQIDDCPHSQIRITQQLQQVEIVKSKTSNTRLILVLIIIILISVSLPHWRPRMQLKFQRSHWLPT